MPTSLNGVDPPMAYQKHKQYGTGKMRKVLKTYKSDFKWEIMNIKPLLWH